MKSRNNSPQTARQQLKTRLQICKNMKQVLKNTKKYENLLTDEQKNLLPNSCDTGLLNPHSENLNELTNPYFKEPPTKHASVPDLSTKLNTESDKLAKMSSSSATTTTTTKAMLSQAEDIARSPKDFSTSAISSKSKRLHPWCKLSKMGKDIKDRSTEKTSAKQQATMESTNQSKVTTGYSADSEEDQASSKTELRDSSEMATKQKREENVTSKKNETVTEQNEVKEVNNDDDSFSFQKVNIKYTKRKLHKPVITKKEVLSIAQYEEAYPWGKEAAKNRENESPLSDKIQKIKEGANKLLPSVMKSKLYQYIEYPANISMKIKGKIKKEGDNFICSHCTSNPAFSAKRRFTLIWHVKAELGYCIFRCSFCEEKSNDPRTLIQHYASTHGIPSNWLESN